jgi:hypothetical protein
MIEILWARFRRLWFHTPLHYLCLKKPVFPRHIDVYACGNFDAYIIRLECECGEVFYDEDEE